MNKERKERTFPHSEERGRESTRHSRRAQAKASRENDHRQVKREIESLRPWLGDEVDAILGRLRIPDREAVSRSLLRAGRVGRAHAIRGCQHRVVVASCNASGGDVRSEGLRPTYCGDRLCPGCASRRAARIGRTLAERLLTQDIDRMLFVTLTQPRIAGETLTSARKRHSESWAALSRTTQWARKHWRALVEGGVRAYEVTWDRGKGWHWHSHSILMLRPGVERGDAAAMILRRWCEVCPGARPGGQHAVMVDATRIWQLAKYPVKPLEGKGVLSPRVMGELIEGTRNARMIQALGNWGALVRGLDDDADDDDGDDKRIALSGDNVRAALARVREHGEHVEIECASRDGDVRARVRWSDVVRVAKEYARARGGS